MLISHVKQSHRVKKIIHFSGGAEQYFKNNFQMVNLIHHEEDFGIKAYWNFYGTAHGKSFSDGIGALFKRKSSRNSLLCKLTKAILTSEKLTERGQKHFQNITILFYSKKEYDKVSRSLKRRFDSIHGRQGNSRLKNTPIQVRQGDPRSRSTPVPER